LLFLKKFIKFLSINLVSLLGCLFYLYLYIIFRDYTQNTNFVIEKTFSEFNLKNILLYRDSILSLIFLLIIRAINYFKKNIIFKKIALLHLVLQFLVIIELIIGYDFQMNMHISLYYLRPLNWITLLLLVFNMKLIFLGKKYLLFLSLLLMLFFNIHTYKYYSNVYDLEKHNLQKQNKVINDIKAIKIFFNKKSFKDKQIYISDAFTNMIYSSIINVSENNIFVFNNGIFRTNKPDSNNSINKMIQYCLHIKLDMLSCYNELLSYDLNSFFNNSFIFLGNRNVELDYFNNKYISLNENHLKANLDDKFFLILNSSKNYTASVDALLSAGARIKRFSILTLFYYD